MAAPNCAGERVGLRAPVWWSSPPGATSHATTATAQQPATRLPSAPGETELSSPLSLSFSLSPPPLRRGLSLSLAHSSSLPLSLNSSLSALSLLLSPNFSLEFCVLPLFSISLTSYNSLKLHTHAHTETGRRECLLCVISEDMWERWLCCGCTDGPTDSFFFLFFFKEKKRKKRKKERRFMVHQAHVTNPKHWFLFFIFYT